MQHEGSNAEQDLERQGNNNQEVSGVEDNPTLPTIVISDGDSHHQPSNDELPHVLSPKKGYFSRTGSSHEQCRVCQQDKEEDLIDLGCKCRGGLAKAHHSCIDTWFRTKGSNKCEICQEVAANVRPPESQPGVCFSPLWVAFSILVGGLLLDVLISITLGVSALPVNIIIGVIVVLGLGTALRLALEFCHEWSLRRVVQRGDTNVNLGYRPAV
ncbi:uncharacterized protein LOC123211487 isoform X2 [Mangifera indica]|uniref:uncharacterized protein LOC123211487 isoform X2 n=1 Tax=Mangifera indica TaxID=29780 RepID=UPI001CF9EB97|nr:uncharacterized protein LOC123211487 isoform X2 [Mangifera indica]